VATPDIVDLLMTHGAFARLSTSEQRDRLVRYYEPWFTVGWKPDTVNNIRATQRLITHAKAMASPVGIILMVILEEASGRSSMTEQGTRGLLGVEAIPADYPDEDETPPDEDAVADDVPAAEDTRVEDDPPPTTDRPKARHKRDK
jgi:hypothetical protein